MNPHELSAECEAVSCANLRMPNMHFDRNPASGDRGFVCTGTHAHRHYRRTIPPYQTSQQAVSTCVNVTTSGSQQVEEPLYQ